MENKEVSQKFYRFRKLKRRVSAFERQELEVSGDWLIEMVELNEYLLRHCPGWVDNFKEMRSSDDGQSSGAN